MANTIEPQLHSARLFWLNISSSEKYLLLEDEETGDVLMPLHYMKSIFEANYSRKLSSLKHRLVILPSEIRSLPTNNVALPPPNSSKEFVYWCWAFEPPVNVKVFVRQALGDAQGHFRLILLPIVYNAMAQTPKLRSKPLFLALHKSFQNSSYSNFIQLFDASDKEENNNDKKKTVLTLSLGQRGVCSEENIFHGPYDLKRSLAKYSLSYEAAEETDLSKKRLMNYSASNASLGSKMCTSSMFDESCIASETSKEIIKSLQNQHSEISLELQVLRKDLLLQMEFIHSEISQIQKILTTITKAYLLKNGGCLS